MKRIAYLLLLCSLIACQERLTEERLFIIFQAEYVASAEKLMALAQEEGIKADTSSNLQMLTEKKLQQQSTVCVLGIPGKHLSQEQQLDLERYIQAGGALLAMETQLIPEYKWPWHHRLMSQLAPESQPESYFTSVHLSTEATADTENIRRLSYEGGRVAMVKSVKSLETKAFKELMTYAIGENTLNYEKCRTQRMPDEKRFVAVTLDDQLNEPMELDVTPDLKVIYIEREGKVKMYDPESGKTKLLANFEVHTEGNYEDGMLGMALDPNFAFNGWIYFYYSPVGDEPKQVLSRFLMSGDSLIMASERIILEVPVQRETCCHSGGSIEFGSDGLLYLSTGDNTSSKESNGYSPLDERPGRGPFDAQKSSGNTNDLRGKILRIKVHPDGSYSIPDGNLFAKDSQSGKPEIYVMGARNPFRISIDPKTHYVYWGDVGPDSGVDSEQGPQSYDEWNQAKSPGNYGWPYFVGDNKAYPDFDFVSNTPGTYFDPEHPVNESPNNTGARELPPARKAMIWYPYSRSEIWPILDKGSRSAMAGPVYYSDRYQKSGRNFPSYYNGKLFIYEWARSWIKVVSFDENGDPEKIENFLPNVKISKPIDMVFGPDGAMYVLEYGQNYFANNEDARLLRIEYAEGNRKPIAKIEASTQVGAAPLKVEFSAVASFDFDEEDTLSYQWQFVPEGDAQHTGIQTSYTFETPGVYHPVLTVTDPEGKSASTQVEIRVGNERPEVEISFEDNRSFYFENKAVAYHVKVNDKEDGQVSPEQIQIQFGFLPQGKDLALLGGKLDNFNPHLQGKKLMEGSDCASCHSLDKSSIGPSYLAIAERYQKERSVVSVLAKKIITGGNGVWGHSLMAAHPQHSMEETGKMVEYILSLTEEGAKGMGLPAEGTLDLDKHQLDNESGMYIFKAMYTDKGANEMPALTGQKLIALRHPKLQAEEYDEIHMAQRQRPNGGDFGYINKVTDGAYIAYHQVDLSQITRLSYRYRTRVGGNIEIRLGSAEGKLVATHSIPSSDGQDYEEKTFDLPLSQGIHNVYFVFRQHEGEADRPMLFLDWIYFRKGEESL
ncbi:PQQ-dependent sugar dehydrogenase [Rapidithrix thailandica]|uniref:PQQ-dependent sugar dehydrogenase n=1 Tax=Rapidithrix thailandica TaxID=413964 RepID=A0AAW9SGM9_9BACT